MIKKYWFGVHVNGGTPEEVDARVCRLRGQINNMNGISVPEISYADPLKEMRTELAEAAKPFQEYLASMYDSQCEVVISISSVRVVQTILNARS